MCIGLPLYDIQISIFMNKSAIVLYLTRLCVYCTKTKVKIKQ